MVLFSGFDNRRRLRSLWTTNGTAAGTSEITVNGAASTGVNPSDMTVFNASVLFNGFDSAGNQGLWTTNGAASGAAEELTGIIGARTTGGLDPTDMTVFNGDILFNGADCPGCGKQMGRELTGVTGASASGIAPSDLTVFDGKVLFSGLDSTGHFQLWETDGTVAGTQELTTTTTPAFHQGVAPSGMEVYDGRVLFSGLDANGVVTSLWTTDGTTAGTHEVTPIADTQRHRQWSGGPQSWTWLERGGNRRLRRRRPFRHPVENADGQAAIWEMNGTNVIGSGVAGPLKLRFVAWPTEEACVRHSARRRPGGFPGRARQVQRRFDAPDDAP